MTTPLQRYEEDWRAFERRHVWHPYASMSHPLPAEAVVSAEGARLRLDDGTELIDGMASWWCVIHGYNHPALNDAIREQLEHMSHVMFGGLTHRPAARLAALLLDLAPSNLEHVFFSDSGSVSVEVAIKMALQYWRARGQPRRQRLLTVRGGYHGDTFGAMAVCDPVNGMHHMFRDVVASHLFAPRPQCRDGVPDTDELEALLDRHRDEIAAVIIEPIVQGAGGMHIYCAGYLRRLRELCDAHGVLLVFDEIATGFGRTGEMFACEHAGIAPDIMCVGKALTGGYMSLAATLCSGDVARAISDSEPGVFMHGPTFMANPLACAVAGASVELLRASRWRERIGEIQARIDSGLEPCRALANVRDVRSCGALGVVEIDREVDLPWMQRAFVRRGVWVRPFRNLVYIMPPYVISNAELDRLTGAITEVVAEFASA